MIWSQDLVAGIAAAVPECSSRRLGHLGEPWSHHGPGRSGFDSRALTRSNTPNLPRAIREIGGME
jgi:hypothetical protein